TTPSARWSWRWSSFRERGRVRRAAGLVAALAALALPVACPSGGDGAGGGGGGRGAPVAVPRDAARLTCWGAPAPGGAGGEIRFEDVTAEEGLVEPLTGMRGHAAAWGDLAGDGRLALFVGTFADRPAEDYQERGADGPAPDALLQRGDGGFEAADLPEVRGRTSGAAFADL